MYKSFVVAAIFAALSSVVARADDGAPSASKLSKLGLSSMQVVDESAGLQVRGRGRGIVGARFFVLAHTSLLDVRGGFIAGPASPAFGTLGTVNDGVNTPFSVTFTQAINGIQFTAVSSVWGTTSGFAN